MTITNDRKTFYLAHLARDARFDGKFFVAVKTTMIYCRPVCPARKAKLNNLRFFIHAAQAAEAGYRPCLRCRPETAPGSTAWLGSSALVQRAIRLMDSLPAEELSIKNIAIKLNIGERWLRDLFQIQVGASPQAILLTKKLDIARNLLDHSQLSITDIAFSAGFQSIRRFNDAFKKRFSQKPSHFRQQAKAHDIIELQLRYRPPYAWQALLTFFKYRALGFVECVANNCYQRLITLDDLRGWLQVSHGKDNKIIIKLKLNQTANLLGCVTRIKNMFDLDADPMVIAASLEQDKQLKPLLKRYGLLRMPGCWDGFEVVVRAIVGQRISVKAAQTILHKLVMLCGEVQTLDKTLALTHFFPTPENILNASLSGIGLTTGKIEALTALAEAVNDNRIILDGTANYDDVCQQLLAIKGIGPWTVDYIGMRALRNPDAFLASDLDIKKKVTQLNLTPQKWRPWRAYAATLLWHSF